MPIGKYRSAQDTFKQRSIDQQITTQNIAGISETCKSHEQNTAQNKPAQYRTLQHNTLHDITSFTRACDGDKGDWQ